jgi:hypothetical protein
MRPQKRVVTKMPLTEIWDDSGTLSGGRIRDLDQSGLRELVLSGSVQFVVADPGLKLNWIPAEECFDFWKTVRPRIADPSGMRDRLVKEMRLAGIDSIAAANHFLETRFLVEWEQRFTVQPRNARNAHVRSGCPACRKPLNSMSQFLDHLANDAMPVLGDRLSAQK